MTWNGHAYTWTISHMAHWCTKPHFEISFQDGLLWEIMGFPILNIWRPFHSQNSGVNDLRWTCLLMNNVRNRPLMSIASFWILGPRWPTSRKLRVLNISRPFCVQISAYDDLSWTCLCITGERPVLGRDCFSELSVQRQGKQCKFTVTASFESKSPCSQ